METNVGCEDRQADTQSHQYPRGTVNGGSDTGGRYLTEVAGNAGVLNTTSHTVESLAHVDLDHQLDCKVQTSSTSPPWLESGPDHQTGTRPGRWDRLRESQTYGLVC